MSTVSSLNSPTSFYRLEEEHLDPSVSEGPQEIESNEDAKAAGVRMPEGIAKGSKKSVSEIIKSLSACLPAEEEPLRIRIWSTYLPAEERSLRIRIWDVKKDAEAIAPKLKEMNLSEEYSQEQFKELMFAQIKSANTQDLNTLMRCMLALNENWNFFDEMQVLEECVVWRRGPLLRKSPPDQVEGNLLIRTMEKDLLPEGWIETIFENSKEWSRLSDWVSFFIRLDEDKIKKYAKEFHFPLSLSNLRVVVDAFRGNEGKLPLFLSSFEEEIHSDVLSILFSPGSFSERIRKECLHLAFSLNLSKDARGVLMKYLFSNDFRDETEKRNDYLENLLKQGQDISFSQEDQYICFPDFLPVETNIETKKATFDLLIKIIKNPRVQHPRPIDWLATVMAYLLNLDLFEPPTKTCFDPYDRLDEDVPLFWKKWNECVTSQKILDLKEEDYSLLKELVSILSTTKPILKGSLGKDSYLEFNLSILASIFLGLDKLRLSGIEHFKREQDKQNWSNEVEALMKKITEAIASNMSEIDQVLQALMKKIIEAIASDMPIRSAIPDIDQALQSLREKTIGVLASHMPDISPSLVEKIIEAASHRPDIGQSFFNYYARFRPYTLTAFLFTKKLSEEQATSLLEAINKMKHRSDPLIKPFLSAWGSLDVGKRNPSTST